MFIHRAALFVIGLIIIFLGLYPILSGFSLMPEFFSTLPPAGTGLYQGLIILFGILSMMYSFQGNVKKKKKVE